MLGALVGDCFEIELMYMFMDLMCAWDDDNSGAKRHQMWSWVKNWYGTAEYDHPGLPNGPITVQKGWHFSTHELWKYNILPYTDHTIVARVLANGERARTWNSRLLGIPGLLASTFSIDGRYIGFGIQSISSGFEEPLASELMIATYGAWPLILADRGAGLGWLRAMLARPRMQSKLGAMEAGEALSDPQPPLTFPWATGDGWLMDLAALGGLGTLLGRELERIGKRDRFDMLVQNLYVPIYTSLKGEDTPFAPPPGLADSDEVPSPAPDWETCKRRKPVSPLQLETDVSQVPGQAKSLEGSAVHVLSTSAGQFADFGWLSVSIWLGLFVGLIAMRTCRAWTHEGSNSDLSTVLI